MTYKERKKWLKARLGKRVFHSEIPCNCEICQQSNKTGFIVEKENVVYWACYTADMELELTENLRDGKR